MNFPRRVIFGGNASGVAAHIRRPENRILHVQAASALPVIGGISEAKAGPISFANYLHFDSAATSAHGDFVEQRPSEVIASGGKHAEEKIARTTVSAKVRGLQVGSRFFAGVADAGLVSQSPPKGSNQPSIKLSGNKLEAIRMDNSVLLITLNEKLFSEYDTLDKLAAAYAKGLDGHTGMFFNPDPTKVSKTLPQSNGTVCCTIVEKMEWQGNPHPDAKIDGNVLTVPKFGTVYFGVMLVSSLSRRLTMIHVQLASPEQQQHANFAAAEDAGEGAQDNAGDQSDGGDLMASEVEDNLSRWP